MGAGRQRLVKAVPGLLVQTQALKRFAFILNRKTALAFCFCAIFVRKPLHTFRKSH